MTKSAQPESELVEDDVFEDASERVDEVIIEPTTSGDLNRPNHREKTFLTRGTRPTHASAGGKKPHKVVHQPSMEDMEEKLAAAYRAPSLQVENSYMSATETVEETEVDDSLHRAVFVGDSAAVTTLLGSMTKGQLAALDGQGNSALHVAVLKQRPSLVLELLEAGVSPSLQNARRWTALDEAVSLKDKEMVKLLYARETAQLKAEMKNKKGDMLKSLQDIPDVNFQLKWELGSPVLGLLLRRYAPHDRYEVWKMGTRMRVDGTLMGLDDNRTSLLPQWKRGHFSLLFDGSTTPATMLLADHAKKKYLDLSKEKKRHRPSLDEEASMIIAEGPHRTKMRASDFHFKVVRTWLGSESTEKIEGWKTRIFEAAGRMMAVTISKKLLVIPPEATFDDYLTLPQPEDTVAEAPIDPYTSLDTSPGKPGRKQKLEDAEKKKKVKTARKLTGRCWMAENFPMSLKQLLPLLDVIGNANKHIARVGKFLQKYGDLSLFPVKLQVPLVYTVYALISFQKFKRLAEVKDEKAKEESWYLLPEGYTLKTFDDIAATRRNRRTASWEDTELVQPTPSDAQILAEMGL